MPHMQHGEPNLQYPDDFLTFLCFTFLLVPYAGADQQDHIYIYTHTYVCVCIYIHSIYVCEYVFYICMYVYIHV